MGSQQSKTFLQAENYDSDLTEWMHRLIRIVAVRTCQHVPYAGYQLTTGDCCIALGRNCCIALNVTVVFHWSVTVVLYWSVTVVLHWNVTVVLHWNVIVVLHWNATVVLY